MEFRQSEIGLIRYAHENDYNYMILLEQKNEINYKLKMIEKNNLKGLLNTKYLILNEEIHIKYNISSKISLSHYLEKTSMNMDMLSLVFQSILDIVTF